MLHILYKSWFGVWGYIMSITLQFELLELKLFPANSVENSSRPDCIARVFYGNTNPSVQHEGFVLTESEVFCNINADELLILLVK